MVLRALPTPHKINVLRICLNSTKILGFGGFPPDIKIMCTTCTFWALRHGDDPDKFLKSEVDLDEEIKKYLVAAEF